MPRLKSISLDFLQHEPFADYLAKSAEYMTSHDLATFRRSPALYKHAKDNPPAPTSETFRFGQAAHTMILEGEDVFREQWAIGGPTNPKTNKPYGTETKAFADWMQAEGHTQAVSLDEFADLVQMRHAVDDHPVAYRLLRSEPGVAEGVVRVTHHSGVKCQSRIDWMDGDLNIVDLKTTRSLDTFEASIDEYGYRHQLAFYRSNVIKASGRTTGDNFIIAVEKHPPFRVGVWLAPWSALADALQDNEEALFTLPRIEHNSNWFTGYEGLRTLTENGG